MSPALACASAILANAPARRNSSSTPRAAARASESDCAAPRASPALACASAMSANALARKYSDSIPQAVRTASVRMSLAPSTRLRSRDTSSARAASPRTTSASRSSPVR